MKCEANGMSTLGRIVVGLFGLAVLFGIVSFVSMFPEMRRYIRMKEM